MYVYKSKYRLEQTRSRLDDDLIKKKDDDGVWS